jgi:hypothetical protein
VTGIVYNRSTTAATTRRRGTSRAARRLLAATAITRALQGADPARQFSDELVVGGVVTTVGVGQEQVTQRFAGSGGTPTQEQRNDTHQSHRAKFGNKASWDKQARWTHVFKYRTDCKPDQVQAFSVSAPPPRRRGLC